MIENEKPEIIKTIRSKFPNDLLRLPEDIALKIYNDMVFEGSCAVLNFEWIKEFASIPHDNKSTGIAAYFKSAIYIINFFSAEDPSKLHYQAARDVLKEAGGNELESQEKARDLLARELVKECRNFASRIIPNEFLQDTAEAKGLFAISKKDEYTKHLIFSVENKLWIDNVFINFITEIGGKGKELAKIIDRSSKRWNKEYLVDRKAIGLFRLWIDLEMPHYFCRYLKLLAEILWVDRVHPLWNKQSKNVPALTKAVLITTIKPPLSKNCKIEISDQTKITCYSEDGKTVAIVPCVDPKLVNLICKGLGAFSSLTGHKLFRWQVRTGFENWANQVEDVRLISTKGGYEGIANSIGYEGNKKAPTDIKAILHAQAHGKFQYPLGGSGNMIILREMDHLKNGEPTKINIILGEMLLPNFTHMLPPGEKRRLVPITELPPLIGSKNTHAAQAMLQLLILEEFSNQSDALFQRSSIQITACKWEELAKEAKLPKTSLLRVISGWIEGDLFAKPFLDKQGNEYTLGAAYGNVISFLECQGEQRITGAKGGEKSAIKKKTLVNKKYSEKKKKC